MLDQKSRKEGYQWVCLSLITSNTLRSYLEKSQGLYFCFPFFFFILKGPTWRSALKLYVHFCQLWWTIIGKDILHSLKKECFSKECADIKNENKNGCPQFSPPLNVSLPASSPPTLVLCVRMNLLQFTFGCLVTQGDPILTLLPHSAWRLWDEQMQ